MSTHRILIVYGTSYGQTAKITRFVADLLTDAGGTVTLVDAANLPHCRELPRGLTPRDFDGVIVGSSVLYGRHQRCVDRFVRAHRDALNELPSAFVSVSGSAASPQPDKVAEAHRLVERFLRDTGWRPQRSEIVAGCMAYTKYSPLLRWIVKRTAAKEGGPTDTSRDHERTDWAQVRRFAEEFWVAVQGAPSGERPLATT